jgi:hypothetical protein
MAVDIRRIALAAVQAALEDVPTKKDNARKGLTAGRAVALGAALTVAARVAAGPGGRFVRGKLQDALSSDGRDEDADDEYDEALDDEYDEDLDEPEDEWDEEQPEAEEDEEPEAEADEEELEAEADEEEPEAEFDEEEPEAEADEEELEDEEPEAEFDEEEPEAEEDEELEAAADDEDREEPELRHPLNLRDREPSDRPGARRRRSRPAARPPRHSKTEADKPAISPPRRPSRPRTPVGRS